MGGCSDEEVALVGVYAAVANTSGKGATKWAIKAAKRAGISVSDVASVAARAAVAKAKDEGKPPTDIINAAAAAAQNAGASPADVLAIAREAGDELMASGDYSADIEEVVQNAVTNFANFHH